MVFFPCCYLHSVSPIKFHTQPKNINYGKYTITHFYYHIPLEFQMKTNKIIIVGGGSAGWMACYPR